MHDHEQEALKYARSHVSELISDHKQYINDELYGLKYLNQFLKILRLPKANIEGTSIDGRLEIKPEGDVIIINPELNRKYKILTIAHELGHWILSKKYSDLANKKSLEWKEKYATYFAYLILIPSKLKSKLYLMLNSAKNVKKIVELSNKYELSITSIMNSLHYGQFENNKFSENKIWIIAKWSENKFTGIDPKLRITSRFFNPTYCYIPLNQGVDRIITQMDLFNNLIIAEEKRQNCNVLISLRNISNQRPKYLIKNIEAECSVVRLNESKWDKTSQIIILIHNFKS